MNVKNAKNIRQVTCIGGGPIGGGWSAHFLARGYRVTTYLHEASEEAALRRLLSTAMVQARNSGVRRFFLGATPAGFRLYEGLGFKTVCSARVWVSGETHQA